MDDHYKRISQAPRDGAPWLSYTYVNADAHVQDCSRSYQFTNHYHFRVKSEVQVHIVVFTLSVHQQAT